MSVQHMCRVWRKTRGSHSLSLYHVSMGSNLSCQAWHLVPDECSCWPTDYILISTHTYLKKICNKMIFKKVKCGKSKSTKMKD